MGGGWNADSYRKLESSKSFKEKNNVSAMFELYTGIKVPLIIFSHK